MYNPFTSHPTANNKSWREHTKFALHASFRLGLSSVCFMLHGLFPFIPVPGSYNFECTIEYLENMNKSVSK